MKKMRDKSVRMISAARQLAGRPAASMATLLPPGRREITSAFLADEDGMFPFPERGHSGCKAAMHLELRGIMQSRDIGRADGTSSIHENHGAMLPTMRVIVGGAAQPERGADAAQTIVVQAGLLRDDGDKSDEGSPGSGLRTRVDRTQPRRRGGVRNVECLCSRRATNRLDTLRVPNEERLSRRARWFACRVERTSGGTAAEGTSKELK